MTTVKADITAADRILKRACVTSLDMIRNGTDRNVYVGILTAAVVSAAVLRGEVEAA